MAASVARAKMVLGVLEGSPILVKYPLDQNHLLKVTPEIFAKSLSYISARDGHLAVLKWARAHGYPWDKWTCAYSARNGHLEVLQWARAHKCTRCNHKCPKYITSIPSPRRFNKQKVPLK